MTGEHSLRGCVRFGVFEADFRAGELHKRGIRIKLQEQPLQILQILLDNPGNVVTRDELQRRIWPADTFVDFDHAGFADYGSGSYGLVVIILRLLVWRLVLFPRWGDAVRADDNHCRLSFASELDCSGAGWQHGKRQAKSLIGQGPLIARNYV